jgi:hypothetical protein
MSPPAELEMEDTKPFVAVVDNGDQAESRFAEFSKVNNFFSFSFFFSGSLNFSVCEIKLFFFVVFCVIILFELIFL